MAKHYHAFDNRVFSILVLPEKACPKCGERRLALLGFDGHDRLVHCRWCTYEANEAREAEAEQPAA